MLTVACVCVPGGIYKRKHVNRLRKQIGEHMEQPYAFHVIDRSDKPGWWAKIDLFQPGRFAGRVLYLDLDVTVVGPLDDLADYPYPFCAIADYQYPLRINSSVMAWDPGAMDEAWMQWTPEVMGRVHGDQDWIHETVPAFRFPRRWCPSYKAHVLPAGKVPDDARVIVYHGGFKPWHVTSS